MDSKYVETPLIIFGVMLCLTRILNYNLCFWFLFILTSVYMYNHIIDARPRVKAQYHKIVSPCDGIVTKITKTKKGMQCIQIRGTLIDSRRVYNPTYGVVVGSRDKNDELKILFRNQYGLIRVDWKQDRRYLQPLHGCLIRRGESIGVQSITYFQNIVEMFVPFDLFESNVRLGQYVLGNITIIGEWKTT
jgi:hypothetical protein